MTIITQNSANELVVNWHITEVCNYSCQYCFGKWEKDSRELIHNTKGTEELLRSIANFFQPSRASRQLGNRCVTDRIRLNIAGGEPFLYPTQFMAIAKEVNRLGLNLSCITNGSRLDERAILEFAPLLDVLGISIDSVSSETNAAIGRADRHGVLNTHLMNDLIKLARDTNPELKIKINTVVNAANWTSYLGDFIEQIAPDRWKVFKVLPTLNGQLMIGDLEYRSFINRHRPLANIMTVENNEAMTHSYLMIDPLGRFYQNKELDQGYDYSDPILEVGIETALSQINFDAERFVGRY